MPSQSQSQSQSQNPNATHIARRRRAFTLVELLVVIAIIGILVALLLPAVQAAREAARRTQCQSNLKNIALAVLNYETAISRFPAAMTYSGTGQPGMAADFTSTWVIEILPYMEEQQLQAGFKEVAGRPIRHPDNERYRSVKIPVMLCASDQYNETNFQGPTGGQGLGANWARGNYAANAGNVNIANAGLAANYNGALPPGIVDSKSPAWSGGLSVSAFPKWPASTRGVMGPNASLRLARVIDGTSKTMMLAEVRAGITPEDPRGVWALGHAGASVVAAHASGGDANGPNACYAKSDDQPASGLTSFKCSDNNATLTAECMTCNDDPFGFAQAAPRSSHVGGVFIAHVDGSVRFILDDIETSGSFGGCCTAWDYLVMSADDGFAPPARRVRP